MKQLAFTTMLAIFLFACNNDDDDSTIIDCTNTTSVYSINLDGTVCTVDIQTALGSSSLYSESIVGTTRTITINGIANHNVGTFPNSGNPNTIAIALDTYTMTTSPSLASSTTSSQGRTFGVLFSGVAVDPYTGEFFQTNTGGFNMQWNLTALQSSTALGLDCNNAHVQPTGRYHYHGSPSRYILDLGTADGTQMIKVGYAGDGFPIYYKYGYSDDGTTIIELTSGYQLKTEERGGDGLSAPSGCSDGLYFQDYEYVNGSSHLDACNGRTGKTPDSASEYYYVITDNFPSSPLCFSGTPDVSFSNM